MKENRVAFTKMHGLGNDFVIINTVNNYLMLNPKQISQLANRYTGIGFDQLLLIENSKNADYFCRIYNADGSEAEQCGNGLRCVARFINETIGAKQVLNIETKAGIFPLSIKDYDHICITMGSPNIKNKLMTLDLNPPNKAVWLSLISMGNPHAIVKVESLDKTFLDELTKEMTSHSLFKNGINLGFMHIVDQNHIKLRTIERGVGETNACGSNACAAVMAGITNNWLDNTVRVEFRYGSLVVDWQEDKKLMHMTGPATRVFDGYW